jgi:hypothetical protein
MDDAVKRHDALLHDASIGITVTYLMLSAMRFALPLRASPMP